MSWSTSHGAISSVCLAPGFVQCIYRSHCPWNISCRFLCIACRALGELRAIPSRLSPNKICRPTRNIHFQGKFRDSWIWTQICLARRLYLENVLKKSKQSWVQFYWLNTFFRLFDVLRRLNQVGANKIVLLTFMWFPRVKLRVISLVLNYVLFETVIFSQKHTFSRKVSRFVDLDANMSCT